MDEGATYMETWGFCRSCDRWFYCEATAERSTACPVCGGAAEVTEDRAVAE